MLGKPDGKRTDAALVPEMVRAFEESKNDDPKVRRYLALSLGRLRDRRATQPLIGALEDADDETRIFAILSLGALGDTSGVISLLHKAESDDPGIKKAVAYTLGLMQDGRAIPTLRGMLNASQHDVQWNAALALCRFQDRSGLKVIEEMLNREFLNRIQEMSDEQREETMMNAIRGVVLLKERSLEPMLSMLKANDTSLKVRQAAIEALEQMNR
jgi:HEAT repeat protein